MTGAIAIAGGARAARAFAARLAAAGFQVENAQSRAATGSSARTLLLVPQDLAECEALLFETQALARRQPAFERIVIAATLSPRYMRALRGRISPSIVLLDAPFSGTSRAAEQGRLSFFLGGRADDIAALQPVLAHLGRRAVRMGGFGAATAAKVMNDFLAASSNAMTRIALDWAEAQGIDEARLVDMTGETLGGLVATGHDLPEAALSGSGDDCVTSLVREVEIALDNALAGAHLTPPRALEDVFRGLRQRHLH
ncbi:MAG: NAD(P)-dependent oxidoreductase [Rhodobacteraceae bacterium]|nr:NAD(P)-dependent oxidoreductase [Paracoccaceae bacterium]